MQPSLIFLSVLSAWFSIVSADLSCKCMPGDPCYPTTQEWQAFSRNLSIPLVVGQRPLGSVCYEDELSFNSDQCSSLAALQSDENFLASRINGLHYLNAGAIVNSTTIQSCAYNATSAPGGICYQGRVPPVVVNVSAVSDIQDAVRFATQRNLRLVVKNTGHEAMGRGFGVGSLELFTFNLKDLKIEDQWVPDGAPCHVSPEQVITVGAGVSWNDAYVAAAAQGRSLVGGLNPQRTVGAGGGWQLGGGHSVLSRFHGLGVDNSLQFTVVLPNATIAIVNNYTNPDLFWALRGGGGPSFGIVVNTTFRTYKDEPTTAGFFVARANTSEAWVQLLEVWMRHHNNISDAGWGGIWPFAARMLSFTAATIGVPPRYPQANATLQAFFDEAKTIPQVNVLVAMSHPYQSVEQFQQDTLMNGSQHGFGFNFSTQVPGQVQSATSSWLLPRNVTAAENAPQLARLMANVTVLGLPFMVGGEGVSSVDPDSSAVTPAWRDTITDMTFISPATGDVDIRILDNLCHQHIQPFRALAPPPYGGQYLNEPDVLEEEWQDAFWGRHYPRLRAIKQQIDPLDLLIVRMGVNSEGWDNEIICKTSD